MLQEVQAVLGYVPPESVPAIASALNLSRAEVHGVITFYHDFRQAPGGGCRVQVCLAEACQAAGARALEAHATATLGVGMGETTADGRITLESVYCLGNCASGPSVRVEDTVHARVDAGRFDGLLQAAACEVADDAVESVFEDVAEPAPETAVVNPLKRRMFIPRDTTACALGADALVAALEAAAAEIGLALELVRSGSRGAFWLEPMIEVEHKGERLAFGPITSGAVPSLIAALAGDPADHPACLGPVHAIPWLAEQRRLTFARAGEGNPLCLDNYRSLGGFRGLDRALAMSPAEVVREITESGLRGRGGAAFPAGIKWQTVLDTPADTKYIVCNADEGDSGTFADRLLMEADPYQLLEGMAIAGLATGAKRGYIYLRSEYPLAQAILTEAIVRARAEGYLGPDLLGSGRAFEIELRMGAGAYICGEETALLESLEGRRGVIRPKPPLPAIHGLFGQPTVVNNVLTLAAATTILAEGAQNYAGLGSGRSRGTLTVQLAGNIRRGGLVEVPYGLTLRELVEHWGGGTLSGRPVRAIQVGGPLGAYLPESQWDLPLDYEAFAAAGAMIGHGGVVVFDDTVDMAAQARFAMAFCALESCGKCTPCRIGSTRGVEVIDRLLSGAERAASRSLLEDLCATMEATSLCAMGGLTPAPVRSALNHFPEDFGL